MKQLKHWQDPVNALLGAWLALSPWVIGYVSNATANYNAVVVGLLLIAAALGAMFVPKAWEEWTEAVLGLWLIVSPWALAFGDDRLARNTAVGTGIVVALLALWTLATDKEYSAWLHKNELPQQ
ncbi:MAG TPA: SPW repeat protein [Burkholderiaceae bacterium]